MPTNTEAFPQYSPGIADSSYQFDYVRRITLAAGATTTVTFPAQANTIRIRQVYIEDVTVLLGGTAPSTGVAAYFRTDGQPASSAILAGDLSASRILRANTTTLVTPRQVNRFIAQENGVSINNPNAAAVTIVVELAA